MHISKPCTSIQTTYCQVLSSHLPEALLISQLHKHYSGKKCERTQANTFFRLEVYMAECSIARASVSHAASVAGEHLTTTQHLAPLQPQQPGMQARLEAGTELQKVSMFLSRGAYLRDWRMHLSSPSKKNHLILFLSTCMATGNYFRETKLHLFYEYP